MPLCVSFFGWHIPGQEKFLNIQTTNATESISQTGAKDAQGHKTSSVTVTTFKVTYIMMLGTKTWCLFPGQRNKITMTI